MSIKTIGVLEDEYIFQLGDGTITYRAKAAIDADGIGPQYPGDTRINDTTLHLDGHPLNAEIDKFIVVPPLIRNGVKGVVMGCQAYCTNLKNGRHTEAVVGDVGPRRKLGEMSIACAKALGIDPNPLTGGEEEHTIHYALMPGKAACVDGKEYQLQPA